jgi:hypothetical protein
MSSTILLPPRAHLCIRYYSNKHTHRPTPVFVANESIHTKKEPKKDVDYFWKQILRLLFLQAHRKTFTVAGMSSQRNQSDSFRFMSAAFYQSLKSKVGLSAAKATALRINLNVEDCDIVADPVHAPSGSRSPSPPPPPFTQSPSPQIEREPLGHLGMSRGDGRCA